MAEMKHQDQQGFSTIPAGESSNPSRVIPIFAAYYGSEAAVSNGLSRECLFKRSFIEPEREHQISFAQLGLLYVNIILESDDQFACIGSNSIPPSQLTLMLRIIIACQTLERAMMALVEFHKMHRPISVQLRSDHSGSALQVHCDDETEGPGGPRGPIIEDKYIQTIFGGLSYFLGRVFPATIVATRNLQHPGLGRPHYSMMAPLHLGSCAAIHFPTETLLESRQGAPSDDIFWSVTNTWLAAISGRAARTEPAAVSIRQMNTAALCEDLGISPATFRRRNSAAGDTFRRYREDTLVETSLALLADDTRTVSSIAAALGYADVRSYRRFIKGATGLTPDQLRGQSDASIMRAFEPQVVARIRDITTRLSL